MNVTRFVALLAALVVSASPADGQTIYGTLRDFRNAHPDFEVLATGPVQGLVVQDGLYPRLTLGGFAVSEPWRSAYGQPIAASIYNQINECDPSLDLEGSPGAASDGEITGPESFEEWYRDVPDVNLSRHLGLPFRNIGGGWTAFEDAAFWPADGFGFGNEREAHNRSFTVHVRAWMEYTECANQLIAVESSNDAWLFVNGELVLDLGGSYHSGESQFIEVDRLSLTGGGVYPVDLYLAHRYGDESFLAIKLYNVTLQQFGVGTVTGTGD